MRLAGIEGCVAHDAKTIKDAVNKAVSDSDVGILLLTEKAGAMVKKYIDNLKMTIHTPLIVEIPDRHGSRDIAESINKMVQESIGLKL
ncbi:MAG: V-type ATP synthase subunit F [Firmicutes bacterium]|nr:V-type ATP synthase subunit F [Bacillota bacterium]